MALSFASQKCDCCGGALKYDNARRIYTCLYCGNEIVRHETYDGQFSVKNVAQQALVSTANRRLVDAEEHLVECSKIDPRYVGTTIANLAYSVMALSMTDNDEKRRRLLAQVNDYHSLLKQNPLIPGSDEELFYQGLESSDVYGMLALVYDAIKDEEREQFVADCVDPANVRSASAAKDLVGYALLEGKYALVDELVQSPAELDCDYVFVELLQRYPDIENKSCNIELISTRITSKNDGRHALDQYLVSTGDCFKTKFEIARTCAASGIMPSTESCLASLLPQCEDSAQAQAVFEMACSSRVSDEDTAAYVAACSRTCSSQFGVTGLRVLKSSGKFAAISQGDVVAALSRDDLSVDEKLPLLAALYDFPHHERFEHGVLSAFLREPTAHPDRPAIVAALVDSIGEVNPIVVEDYLTHFSTDGPAKGQVVEALLRKNPNAAGLKRALSAYLTASPDTPEVTQSILDLMVAKGLVSDEVDVVSRLCSSGDAAMALATVRSMKSSGWRPPPRGLDTYLLACAKGTPYASQLAAELFVDESAISSEALSMYVLYCHEPSETRPAWIHSLVPRAQGTPGSIRCRVAHHGRTVDCSLLQGYLLSPDSEHNARAIIRELDDGTGAVHGMIMVADASGTSTMKFKKYVGLHKATLSSASVDYCTANKLFGGLF